MSDIETLYTVLPKTRKVQLTCGAFEIKPLSTRALIELMADMKGLQGQVNGKLGEGRDHEVVIELLTQTGDKMPGLVAKLMGLKCPSDDVLKALEDMTLEDMSVAAMAVSEVNSFNRIFKNFRAAMDLKKEQK